MESITSVLNNYQFLLTNFEPRTKKVHKFQKTQRKQRERQKSRTSIPRDVKRIVEVQFEDFKDIYNTKVFQDNFQRPALNDMRLTTCVTLEDVKDVVLYTAVYDIPEDFVRMFLGRQVDRILRSLILYMQYFLTVFRVVQQRREALNNNKIRHPAISVSREALWKFTLSNLRFLVVRDYFHLLMGLNGTQQFHHYDRIRHLSRQKRDLTLYQLLHIFIKRVLEVVLMEKGNPLIEEELDRLFSSGASKVDRKDTYGLTRLDLNILEGGNINVPRLLSKGTLSKEFFRPNRDPLLKNIGEEPWLSREESTYYQAIEFALAGSESRYADANVYMGILGCNRSDFDCFLNVLQRSRNTPPREKSESPSGMDSLNENGDNALAKRRSIHLLRSKPISMHGPNGILLKRVEQYAYIFREDYLGRCENYDTRHMSIRKARWIDFRTANSRMNYPPDNLGSVHCEEQFPSEGDLTEALSSASKKTPKSVASAVPPTKRFPNASGRKTRELPSFFFCSVVVPSDREDDITAPFYEGAYIELLRGSKAERGLRPVPRNLSSLHSPTIPIRGNSTRSGSK